MLVDEPKNRASKPEALEWYDKAFGERLLVDVKPLVFVGENNQVVEWSEDFTKWE